MPEIILKKEEPTPQPPAAKVVPKKVPEITKKEESAIPPPKPKDVPKKTDTTPTKGT